MISLLRDKNFRHATALMIGAMVGVGIFGIPFVFAKAGIWIGVGWLIALAVLTGLYNLMFAELTLRTQGNHQVAGYANIWLGPWARRLTFLANALAGYGAMVAYMIIVGEFLHTILSGYFSINTDWYGIVFAIGWSLIVVVRVQTVAIVDQVMTVLFGLVIGLIVAFGLPHVAMAHFPGTVWEYWFLPYGVIMFALSGANAVPIQRQLLAGREKMLRPAIITAVVFVAFLYLIFALTVVGITGEVTTPDSISGLYEVVGPTIVKIGSLFGVLTISTSFLMMATGLYKTYRMDYRVPTLPAWLLVIVPPLVFFTSGLRNFIDVISLVGSVAVGVLAVVVLGSWIRARHISLRRPEWTVSLPVWAAWVLMGVFISGILYALIIR